MAGRSTDQRVGLTGFFFFKRIQGSLSRAEAFEHLYYSQGLLYAIVALFKKELHEE
jgi:hypothetical protein